MHRQRIAMREIWARLKFALPNDTTGLRSAAAIADSLLADKLDPTSTTTHLQSMAGVASLRGRAYLAAMLARQGATAPNGAPNLPTTLTAPAAALLAYAALGAPVDSISEIENRLLAAIRNDVPSDQWSVARYQLLGRAATLAFPTYRSRSAIWNDTTKDYLIDAESAFRRNDVRSVRRILERVQTNRKDKRPAELTFDALYPEAWLLRALGDSAAAVRWIDPTLREIEWTSTTRFTDFTRAAALVRTMALRAEMAAAAGDTVNARRWANAVIIVWSNADMPLQPVTMQMRGLLSSQKK
jgi:hypothetical protein